MDAKLAAEKQLARVEVYGPAGTPDASTSLRRLLMLVDRGIPHRMVFDVLIAEHRTMAALIDRALAVPADEPGDRLAVLGTLARLLRAHARAEQEILFPALDGSYELGHHVREDTAEHAVIEALLRAVEQTPAHAPDWEYRVVALRVRLLAHFTDEEQVVFPKAHAVIADPQAMDLGIEYELDRDRYMPHR